MSRARGGKGLYEPLKYVDVERIVRNSQGEPYSTTLRKIENEIDKAKKKILKEMVAERTLYSIYGQAIKEGKNQNIFLNQKIKNYKVKDNVYSNLWKIERARSKPCF